MPPCQMVKLSTSNSTLTLELRSWKRWFGNYHIDLGSTDLFTQDEKDKAFAEAAVVVKGYSDELVTRWSLEINTYLVYAGLFSAILTAFNVESYQLLQPVSPDPTSVVLQHISLQLSSLPYRPPFINSSYPAFDAADSSSARPPVTPLSAIWLNTLWFSSLVLSLSSASVGILVKQWLNEYQSGLSGDSQHIVIFASIG
ncbi:hypothetical protein GY45DRAFT_1399920 [Cubamyces sp. BRFM 1775]|nr:hypothetical protein GY45DRAFT_1399920 [Cubamyces sp. BRFM 1775]